MVTRLIAASALVLVLALTAAPVRAEGWGDAPGKAMMAKEAMPPAGTVSVHTAIGLPEFLPGLGKLFVDPKTLPVGPYLAYDREGKQLVSTIYMVPLKTFDGHLRLDGLKTSGRPVDHVDMSFNPGHPGVAEPHYHIVLWHVSGAAAAAVK
ncbi:MAG: hypothetical protein WCO00_04255 [Rhodospirillaceae bacterium]